MLNFLKKYEKVCVYLYGAGVLGERVYRFLKSRCHIKGFIVSDNREIVKREDIPIYHLSDIVDRIADEMILVTVNSDLQEEIISELRKAGIMQVACLEEKECYYFNFM